MRLRQKVAAWLEANLTVEVQGMTVRNWLLSTAEHSELMYAQDATKANAAVSEYLVAIRKEAEGGTLEMFVYSRISNVEIRIYEDKVDWYQLLITIPTEGSPSQVKYLLYKNRNHY